MILSTRRVTTRKEHECWGCQRVIAAGQSMDVCVSVDMGRVQSDYLCAVCQAFSADEASGLDFLADEGDTYAVGDVRNANPELWEATRVRVEAGVQTEPV